MNFDKKHSKAHLCTAERLLATLRFCPRRNTRQNSSRSQRTRACTWKRTCCRFETRCCTLSCWSCPMPLRACKLVVWLVEDNNKHLLFGKHVYSDFIKKKCSSNCLQLFQRLTYTFKYFFLYFMLWRYAWNSWSSCFFIYNEFLFLQFASITLKFVKLKKNTLIFFLLNTILKFLNYIFYIKFLNLCHQYVINWQFLIRV